jgi:hypothetical protein
MTNTDVWAEAPAVPTPVWGAGWAEAIAPAEDVHEASWFELLNRIGFGAGTGALTVKVVPRSATHGQFSGGGELAVALVIRTAHTVEFSGNGLPTADRYQLVTGVTANFTADGSLTVEREDGLSATVIGMYPARFAGDGIFAAQISGGIQYPDGLSAIAVPGVPGVGGAAGGEGTVTMLVVPRYLLSSGMASSGFLSATATAVSGFTPFTEENVNRVNQPVPAGCTGVWVTLIGQGGGAGSGRRGSAGAAGGTGGGGGAFIPRVFIPVANLGSTYSTTVATGSAAGGAGQTVSSANGNPGTDGAATTFVSGATNMSAGGGARGLGGTNGTSAGGAGGTVSGATGDAGEIGGGSSITAASGSGFDNGASASGGAGGGGGGSFTSSSVARNAGKGGDTNGQAGGAAATSVAQLGGTGSAPVAGVAGSGGGGSYPNNSTGNAGGSAPGYGGGGGGGGAGAASPTGAGGSGGPGYNKLEWV